MTKLQNGLSGLSLLLLAACGSAPTRLYTLQPVARSDSPVDYQGPPVRVGAVNFPADLDRTEIVTARGDGELRISEQNHWAAPLSKMAQQTLSADLVNRLPAGKVAFPRLTATAAVAELRVDILRMPGREGDSMQASWQLSVDSHVERGGLISLPDQPLGGQPAAVAHSLDALLAHLADEIARQLPLAGAAN